MEEELGKKRQFTKRNNFNAGNNLPDQLGKLPPQALDLEEAVLGALMLEKNALTAVIDILHPESFYKDAHQKIYAAILQLFDKSEPVDILTVTQELRKAGELELAGGAFYITKLTSKVNSAANIEFHSRIITECAIKRDLIRIAGEVEREAFEDQTDVFQLLDKAEAGLYEVSNKNIKKAVGEMRSLMRQAIEELEAKKDQADGLTGVPTGFSALDRVTSGWQKSDLVIIAARPGMGKTAFSLSALRNAAVDFDTPVAFFSCEMSSVQLVNRLIASEAELDSEKLRKGTLAAHEWQQLHSKIGKLTESKIFIDDTPGLSVREFRTKARRLKQQHDIQVIIIDYLQLMTGNEGKGGNREQEIAFISRSLKGVAKELDVPVIALSQLSRSVETRGGDKKPMLSDLRESGSIEQDADIVMFLYRPDYYGITEITDADGAPMPAQGIGEVIIAKHRNGTLENVPLKFIGKYTKFADLEESSFIPVGGGELPSDTITMGSKMNASENDDDFFGPSSKPSDPFSDDSSSGSPSANDFFDDEPPF